MNDNKERGQLIKVLAISSSHLVREGLRAILGSHRRISGIAELSGYANTALVITREKPEVIILDMDIADANVLDLVREFRKSAQDAKILLIGGFSDQEGMHQALQAGAHGVVLKVQPLAVLLAAIESLCDRGRSLGTPESSSMDKSPLQLAPKGWPENDGMNSLTAREREIIEWVSKGLSNKEVADHLCICNTTVRHHLTSIFDKLEISNRQQLLIFAHQCGLIQLSADKPTRQRRELALVRNPRAAS